MKTLKHMIENPFIAGAGIAALAHSTWSLGTLFSGQMPGISISQPTSIGQWLYWFVPAFLIAFALDVGQVSTSSKIRHEGLTWQRGVTFFVFAIATYYLQFLYIAHHMPLLQIESGISDLHRIAVTELRNAAIWILPALLPLATLLYTLSGNEQDSQQHLEVTTHENSQDIRNNAQEIQIVAINQDMATWTIDYDNLHSISCPDCEWSGDGYKSERSAQMALKAHQKVHSEAVTVQRLEMSE